MKGEEDMSILDDIRLLWPVDERLITQGFGGNAAVYARFGLPGHNGIDIGCASGSPVRAAAEGSVVQVGWDANGYGNYVKLEHGGYQTLYAHLKKVLVGNGAHVKAGDLVGLSDNTGFSTGPHLHFELRVPGYIAGGYKKGEMDPMPFFVAGEAVAEESPEERKAEEVKRGDWVELDPAYSYVNLRPKPSADAWTADLGDLTAGVPLEVVDTQGEWIGVKVWVHGGFVRRVEK